MELAPTFKTHFAEIPYRTPCVFPFEQMPLEFHLREPEPLRWRRRSITKNNKDEIQGNCAKQQKGHDQHAPDGNFGKHNTAYHGCYGFNDISDAYCPSAFASNKTMVGNTIPVVTLIILFFEAMLYISAQEADVIKEAGICDPFSKRITLPSQSDSPKSRKTQDIEMR